MSNVVTGTEDANVFKLSVGKQSLTAKQIVSGVVFYIYTMKSAQSCKKGHRKASLHWHWSHFSNPSC